MAEDFELEFAVLNIAAQPHPQGIYLNLVNSVAGSHVNFFDNDWAVITEPERQPNGLYIGRILVWTELDPNAPAIDKKKLEEVSLEDAKIKLPEEFGINGRTFIYVLRVSDHRIFYECRNDLGDTLGPKRCQRIFDRLFVRTNLTGEIQVTISIQNEEDALSRILKLPVLRSFEVHLVPPNPDDDDEPAARVLKHLEDQAAKSKTVRIEKKAGKTTLKPSDELIEEAEVAASGNGFVSATGKDRHRQNVKLSTADYPMKIVARVMDRVGAVNAAIRVARDTIIGRR